MAYNIPKPPYKPQIPFSPWYKRSIKFYVISGVVVLSVIFFGFGGTGLFQETEIIFDTSGSMSDSINEKGSAKIDIAKEVFKNIVSKTIYGSKVGLRLIGSSGCSSELVYPIENIDKNKFLSSVEKLQPSGSTPISSGLTLAKDDFSKNSSKKIILITDGQETCGGNPCTTIEDLVKKGFDVRVDTIGFGLADDDDTSNSLKCIADKTGGTYRAANDKNSLNTAISSAMGLSKFNSGWFWPGLFVFSLILSIIIGFIKRRIIFINK